MATVSAIASLAPRVTRGWGRAATASRQETQQAEEREQQPIDQGESGEEPAASASRSACIEAGGQRFRERFVVPAAGVHATVSTWRIRPLE